METLPYDHAAHAVNGMRVHSIQAGMSTAYLLESDVGLVLVDAGSPGRAQKILGKMKELGRSDLRLIFITHAHFDHYGSAAAIRRHTGAPVAIHAADAGALRQAQTPLGQVRSWGVLGKLALPLAERLWPPEPTVPDIVIRDGHTFEEFGFDARVVHTPGHTPGSSSLLVNGDLLFVGDLISSRPWLCVQCYYASDWAQIDRSVKGVLNSGVSRIFPGHGPPVTSDTVYANATRSNPGTRMTGLKD